MAYPVSDSTPAVTFHAQAHNQWIDVKAHYGATGDGTTDDTAAIQAAITAIGATAGGIVYFPAGVYRTTAALTVVNPNVAFMGTGWDQATLTAGSVIRANAAMTDLINASSAATTFSTTQMFLDGNGQATNVITSDSLNAQFVQTYVRRPATNGIGWNITSNGASPWFVNCRFNGANQAGCVGWLIGATDSTMMGCKGVNCLDSVQYGAASGGIQQGCHHTPGSTIGRCCINLTGNSSQLQIIGNRIDNHKLGSGIQLSASANVSAIQIEGNTFFQNAITDATFAAIGVDTSNASYLGLQVVGNNIRSAAAHNYTALLSSQTLAGAAATNPGRMATQGTIASSNTVYAAALFGNNPMIARGNAVSTDGTTWAIGTEI